MTTLPDTTDILNRVERHAGRNLLLRNDIALLMDAAISAGLTHILEELQFRAKFVVKARDILSRIGPDSADAAYLAPEFRESVEHVTRLIRSLSASIDGVAKDHLEQQYLALSQHSLENLMVLCRDLTAVKNYFLDTAHTGTGR